MSPPGEFERPKSHWQEVDILKMDETAVSLVAEFPDLLPGAGPCLGVRCNRCDQWIWRFGNHRRRPMTTTVAWIIAAVSNHLCEETHDGDVSPAAAR